MPTNTPLVSIIIPTYNRAHLIGETLDSVLAQTYQNWECIVVDDGSSDNTAEVMARYMDKDARFQYHHRPKDRLPGGNAARNYGFEVSKGEFIQWFDSDDLMHPEKLSIQTKILDESDFKFSVCETEILNATNSEILKTQKKSLYSKNLISDFITYKVIVLTQNLLIKRDFLNTFKYLFDEELKAAQDWEFNFRLLYKARIYDVCEMPLAFIRKHTKNISSNNQRFLIYQYFIARMKIYQNPDITLNKNEKKNLQEFLHRYFKKMVRMRDVKGVFKAYTSFVASENDYSFKTKTFAFLSILSFGILNKGDCFLKNVYYKYEKK